MKKKITIASIEYTCHENGFVYHVGKTTDGQPVKLISRYGQGCPTKIKTNCHFVARGWAGVPTLYIGNAGIKRKEVARLIGQ